MDVTAHLLVAPPVEVVYVDLDGTLLGLGGSVLAGADGRPSLDAVGALVAARRAGIAVAAVTGRHGSQTAEAVRLLGLDGGVAEAGAVLIGAGGGRPTAEDLLWGECPRGSATTPRRALEEAGAVQALLDAFPGRLRRFLPWDAGRIGGHLLHGVADLPTAAQALSAAGASWAHLLDNGPTTGWAAVDRATAYHLLPRGVGKATGVTEDLRRRGVDPSAAVCIGDSVEDASLAAVVGTYVSVAGGHRASGPTAFSVPGRAGAGVAQVITAIIAARRAGRVPGTD